jgi:Outer membrane protein beta-barrel domain
LSATTRLHHKGVRFGVKAGFNVSTVYWDIEYDPTIGFCIGGLADFTVSKKIHIQPELLYSMEGFKDASISYLRLPIMVKYYTTNRFNIQLGSTIGLRIPLKTHNLKNIYAAYAKSEIKSVDLWI